MCNRQKFQYRSEGHHAWKNERRKRKMQHWEQWAKAKGFGHRGHQPPVNILELDDQYELHLFAADLSKEDFKIALVDNLLTISAEQKTTPEGNWRRREYEAGGFSRRFELNDKIDTESIAASYKDGVLKVTFKKLAGFETSRSEITVA